MLEIECHTSNNHRYRSVCGYHPGDKACFLSVPHFAVCWGFQVDPIWRCLKNLPLQPRHDCMSSPFVACSLSKYYWKKFISFKKSKNEKGVQVQISKTLVSTVKESGEILINYYCHCTFSQYTVSMKRHTAFHPLKFTGFESFSAIEACMTCQLSCRHDLLWNEENVWSVCPCCLIYG